MLSVGWRLRSPECVRILPAVDGMHVASWDDYNYDHQYWEWDNASMPAFDMAATYPSHLRRVWGVGSPWPDEKSDGSPLASH
jgi:hypothetical protein